MILWDYINLVGRIVDLNSQVNSVKEAHHKVYERQGRLDKITLIESWHLKSIRFSEWKKI